MMHFNGVIMEPPKQSITQVTKYLLEAIAGEFERTEKAINLALREACDNDHIKVKRVKELTINFAANDMEKGGEFPSELIKIYHLSLAFIKLVGASILYKDGRIQDALEWISSANFLLGMESGESHTLATIELKNIRDKKTAIAFGKKGADKKHASSREWKAKVQAKAKEGNYTSAEQATKKIIREIDPPFAHRTIRDWILG